MGGINHQPCNQAGSQYLRYSTLMSRSVSMSNIRLQKANITLEDILLHELQGSSGSLPLLLSDFSGLRVALFDTKSSIGSLRLELQRFRYKDLPTLRSVDLLSLGEQMVRARMVEPEAWKLVSEIMENDGFYAVLDLFEGKVDGLINLTKDLVETIEMNREATERGELNLVLEQNRVGNFKTQFARLYTAWGNFHSLFLASSMLSTELWYAYTLCGSILEPQTRVNVA